MFYRALEDAKVIEYGNLFSAPFCSKILGDIGAEVIKIEKPDYGDDLQKTRAFLKGRSKFRAERLISIS